MTPALQTDRPHAVNPVDPELHALLHGAGLAPLDDLGWIRITGEDRVRWLNGMVTNSITDLTPGLGCFNFFLSAQGRIQGTAYAFALSDSILLRTERAQIPSLLTMLDRFIIMDDVELADITETRVGISLTSPRAGSLLAAIDLTTEALDPLELVTCTWQSASIDLIHAYSPLVPRFDMWTDLATSRKLQETLTIAGAQPIGPEALETLRILEGTPRYGTDIRNSNTTRDLPQETAQTHALHFSKGCYLGQEIVERIHSRGNVHRTFTGFRLEGALPAPGTHLHSGGKQVGELTSIAAIPSAAGTVQIALGYIRREALAPFTYLVDEGLAAEAPGGEAFSVPLPFGDL